jgi:NAD(P)-dependent dehydrogenase (short-subunit alcohol dehydrogenase family)
MTSRSAIVTGGARGLGEKVAERLVHDGMPVVLVDVSSDVEATADRLGNMQDEANTVAVVGDVSDEAVCARAASTAIEAFGGVSVLANVAGIGGPGTPVTETSAADFRRVIDVNLVGTFLMSRVVARELVRAGSGGTIVNTSSIFGQQGVVGDAGYGSSKAGVILLTQVMALELAPFAIRVNVISPGNMATEMHFDYVRALAHDHGRTFEEELDAVRSTIPLGRHGTGEDIAGAVAWLASDDASYVTGQTIGVNGGVLFS